MKKFVLFLICAVCLMSCKTEKIASAPEPEKPHAAAVASPAAIIYKMKHDYSQNVPVILSEDKQTIASYPHPRDMYTNGKLAMPTALTKGYWLDNRGINERVAFLKYTYEEYASLSEAPAIQELKENIIDDDPIKEMWNCGPRHRYQDIINDLNELIKSKQLKEKCTKIK